MNPENKIPTTDPRWESAQKVLNAMHDYWKLDPYAGAVRWIEDTGGMLVVFTRGEYKHKIREAIAENLHPEEYFEERIVEQYEGAFQDVEDEG